MKTILNYICTKHFQQRMLERQIDEFTISLILTYGKFYTKSSRRQQVVWTKDRIEKAIFNHQVSENEMQTIKSISLIISKNSLITLYKRCGDTGINNFKN
jgi:hypothetical protein